MLNRNTITVCVEIFLWRLVGEFLDYITHFSEEVETTEMWSLSGSATQKAPGTNTLLCIILQLCFESCQHFIDGRSLS